MMNCQQNPGFHASKSNKKHQQSTQMRRTGLDDLPTWKGEKWPHEQGELAQKIYSHPMIHDLPKVEKMTWTRGTGSENIQKSHGTVWKKSSCTNCVSPCLSLTYSNDSPNKCHLQPTSLDQTNTWRSLGPVGGGASTNKRDSHSFARSSNIFAWPLEALEFSFPPPPSRCNLKTTNQEFLENKKTQQE